MNEDFPKAEVAQTEKVIENKPLPQQSAGQEPNSFILNDLQEKQKQEDANKLAEVRDQIQENKPEELNVILLHLLDYFGLKENDLEKIIIITANESPADYQAQLKFLNDSRLNNVKIAIVPDNLWVKGSQPTESTAEMSLITVKQSYFESQQNTDEVAWILHELAHCQKLFNYNGTDEYIQQTQKGYPDNPIERYAFGKQFQFLKEQGKSKDEILNLIKKYYPDQDIPFLDEVLASTFNQ